MAKNDQQGERIYLGFKTRRETEVATKARKLLGGGLMAQFSARREQKDDDGQARTIRRLYAS